MLLLVSAALVLSHEPSRSMLEDVFQQLAPIAADNLFSLLVLTVSLAVALKVLSRIGAKHDAKKQGAYGAVPVHEHSLADQLSRPQEVTAALKLLARKKFGAKTRQPTALDKALWNHLDKTSRSFAAVIRVLPAPAVSDAVCIFYLLLRALDTVEDEMDLTKFEEFCKGNESPLEAKVRLLQDFHKLLANDETSKDFPLAQLLNSKVGAAAEKALLHAVPELISGFHHVKEQGVIREIVREMGIGMAEYVVRDMNLGTTDMADYDRYCHIVAGLVGKGLTEIFCNLGYEDVSLVSDFAAWNSMGLLLQRTNITRDVCEDAAEGRSWWPQTIWRNGADAAQGLAQLRDMSILNKMVCNALSLVPEATRYLDRLSDPAIFGFCALPQIMAIATLAACYNNPDVYSGVVKIRQGQAAKLVLALESAKTVAGARRKFKREAAELIDDIRSRAVVAGDADTAACCTHALEAIGHADWSKQQRKRSLTTTSMHIACTYIAFVFAVFLWRSMKAKWASSLEALAGGDSGLLLAFGMSSASITGAIVFGVMKKAYALM